MSDKEYEIRAMYESLSWYNELATGYNHDNGSYIIPICEIYKTKTGAWILRRITDDGYKSIRIETRALFMNTFVDGMSSMIEYQQFGF